jgi:tungstate transport system permease protein
VALAMVTQFDPRVTAIVALSLAVSLTSTLCSGRPSACRSALPWRSAASGSQCRRRRAQRCDGLPPVVVGLLVYLMLSRAGPLGELGLLFTPRRW